MSALEPLADRLRPTSLKDVIGHDNLVKKGGLIDHIIRSQTPISLLLWGPPGAGKTTIARIIATELKAECIELSAVTSGIADVKRVISVAEANKRLGMQTVLFVDEIHRFNKAQQDAFLPHVERGTITLIGATTENPAFEIITPLLSRMRVVTLQPLSDESIQRIIKKALNNMHYTEKIPAKVLALLAHAAVGDARVALGTLEVALSMSPILTDESVRAAIASQVHHYDKSGDIHYHLASAFIKSMRGSDATATLYYLARMLQGGEDPKFIARRMIIFASEDIGIASSPALNLAVSTFLAVERVGLPECEYALYHCATVLAAAKKSRTITDAMERAKKVASETGNAPVPLHIRNPSAKLLKDMDYGSGYQWKSGFEHPKGFMPENIKDVHFF